jgi:hypothetical protein
MNSTPSEVRAYYGARVHSLKITSQREWRGSCPVHQGKDPNFSVNAETGLAQCHSQCGRGWDLISLEMELSGLDFPKAKERGFDLIGRPRVSWEERNPEAAYNYTDENGKLLEDPPLVRRVPKLPQRTEDNARQGFLEQSQYERLLSELPERLKALFVCAYHVGTRKGELRKIHWSQVDFEASKIHFSAAQTKS